MKLNLVPARTGLLWVKLGFKTYFRQPLALSGLFFMFMALLSIASLVPFVGTALTLALLPATTLGLMAATKEATTGKFPMPLILVSAFRAGRQQRRAMVILGVLYAGGFLALMGISMLIDGGQFAKFFLLGGSATRDPAMQEIVSQTDFQISMWITMALYLPLSLMFWHAPALVHWHGVSPVKSLFFSFIACCKNWAAMTVYGLAWSAVFAGGMMLVMLISALLGNATFAAAALFPMMLMMMALFFTSVFFTFRDSFTDTDSDPETVNPTLIPGD
jgi:hypothetical protein